MGKLEINRTLVLSMRHMTCQDSRLLNFANNCAGPNVDKDVPVSYELEEYGWLVYTNPDWTTEKQLKKFSQGFVKAVRLAREHNCTYIRFDVDGPEVDELEIYDW